MDGKKLNEKEKKSSKVAEKRSKTPSDHYNTRIDAGPHYYIKWTERNINVDEGLWT